MKVNEVNNLELYQIKELLCSDCQFYKPEEPDELECGSFQILITLLKKGVLDLEQMAKALE